MVGGVISKTEIRLLLLRAEMVKPDEGRLSSPLRHFGLDGRGARDRVLQLFHWSRQWPLLSLVTFFKALKERHRGKEAIHVPPSGLFPVLTCNDGPRNGRVGSNT